ncbi:TPA: TIGR03757 family integrating conjugative element protein [Salmonella enterica]|uniref:TIGR03757 family integrating conjugative element protein n=1 Tax=Salmonella enterica TaxID=28901 RepID=UPI0009B105B5|nr:TIGR03757 family integrating conjugative element protein [Salmonella enterica]HBD1844100.1 TIGR03757 family integrating conjugative element protein [Salmonella enterica]
MKVKVLFLSSLMSLPVLAGTTVYTDSEHPPMNLSPDTQVIWLDRPTRLQSQLFGGLSADPLQAEVQAKAVLRSAQWTQQERQLVESLRLVVQAHELGVRKYPAVVFDDKYVVYGTADVAHALTLRGRKS